MSKAEERALEAYPPTFTSGKRYAKRVQSEKVDTHAPIRSIFIKGYEQAEKDLALTPEDIKLITKIHYEIVFMYTTGIKVGDVASEILTRFKQFKEDNK